jgi:NarL family two-component system sensor histidine kinase LiaS
MPRRSVTFTKTVDRTINVDLRVANGLYRISQQALSNAIAHSEATKIDVRLEVSDQALVIYIEDNGRGFRLRDTYSGGTGLRNLAQRASEIGARLTLRSKSGGGIYLSCCYTQFAARGV